MTKDHKYGLIFAVVFPLVGVLISSIMLSAYGSRETCSQSVLAVFCPDFGAMRWARNFGIFAFVASAGVAAIFFAAAQSIGDDRSRIARSFPHLVRFALLASAAVGLADAFLFAALVRAMLSISTAVPDALKYVAAGINIAALAAAIALIRNIYRIESKLVQSQSGLLADPEKHAALFEAVGSIVEKFGARSPDRILIGMDPTFYATGADISTIGQSEQLTGETLYLSAPLLRLLSSQERLAVIAHELGHFAGSDTAYSLQFVPIYGKLQRTLSELGELDTAAAVAKIPSLTFIDLLLAMFVDKERRVRRDMEREADRKAATISGSEPLISALLKIGLFARYLPQLRAFAASKLSEGKAVLNLCDAYIETLRASSVTDEEQMKRMLSDLTKASCSHPTDSHPTNYERAHNLGVDIETVAQRVVAEMRQQMERTDERLLSEDFEILLTDYENAINFVVARSKTEVRAPS